MERKTDRDRETEIERDRQTNRDKQTEKQTEKKKKKLPSYFSVRELSSKIGQERWFHSGCCCCVRNIT